VLLALIGIFVAWAVYRVVKERRKIRAVGIKVEGVIFELNNRLDSDGCNCYYPVVRYLTLEKEWMTQEYYVGRNPSPYQEGDKVIILYDPDDPKQFILDGKADEKAARLVK
jgi:hypothetical protein